MRPAAAVFALLALVACSARTPVAEPTASRPASRAPRLTPSTSPTSKRVPYARKVAYIASEGLFIYDARSDSVVHAVRAKGLRMPRWVGAQQVSFVQANRRVRLFDLKTREVRDVVDEPAGLEAYAWSPDRRIVATMTVDERDYAKIAFRLLEGAGATQPLGTLARVVAREGTPDDEVRVEFSPDGSYAVFSYTAAEGLPGDDPGVEQSRLQVRDLEGRLVHAAEHDRLPTMAAWSPDARYLYYRTERGARAWEPRSGRLGTVRGGVRWYNPSLSRDARLLAYDTGATSTRVAVRVLDLRRGSSRVVARGMFRPVLASSSFVWAQRVRPCPGCLAPVAPAREVVAVDLRSGKERKLALPSLEDADVLYL